MPLFEAKITPDILHPIHGADNVLAMNEVMRRMADSHGTPMERAQRPNVVAPIRSASLCLLEVVRASTNNEMPVTTLRALVGEERTFIEVTVPESTLDESVDILSLLRASGTYVSYLLPTGNDEVWVAKGMIPGRNTNEVTEFLNLSFPTRQSR